MVEETGESVNRRLLHNIYLKRFTPTILESPIRVAKGGPFIHVKRDDLYPVSGGGNKGRKMRCFLERVAQQQANALVSCGAMQSNHARVVALTAAACGWPCRLILHGNAEDLNNPTGNLLLMMLTGAIITVTEPNHVGKELEKAMATFRAAGLNPYEIPGGGHALEGSLAYAEAVDELAQQWERGSPPDGIVLASGTGTTQAGLMAGVERQGWSTRVIGISVARENPRGSRIVGESYQELRDHFGLKGSGLPVEFLDDYVGDGYEKADAEVLETIRRVARQTGILLDPTYTGKAYHGMLDLIEKSNIQENAHIVFWHTGGLLNLVASTYWQNG